MFEDEELLLISGLQHLMFCEKQWSLIHVEKLWAENILTVEGAHLHDNVHSAGLKSRGDLKLATGLQLRSSELGLYGVADMVEFVLDSTNGVEIPSAGFGKKRWMPYPVEYKRGRARWDNADEIQLCAQAICLEEMLGAKIKLGAVYYGEPRKRSEIQLSAALREEVRKICARGRDLLESKDSAKPNKGKHCKNCSMREFCMPEITLSADSSEKYIKSLYKISDGE